MAHTSHAMSSSLITTLARLPASSLPQLIRSKQHSQHLAAVVEDELARLANDALDLIPPTSSQTAANDIVALLSAIHTLGDASLLHGVVASPAAALDLAVVVSRNVKASRASLLLPSLISEAQRIDLLTATTSVIDQRPSADALRRAALVITSIQRQFAGPADGLLSRLDRAWRDSSASTPSGLAGKSRRVVEAERILWLASRAQLLETTWHVLVSLSHTPQAARSALEEAQRLVAQEANDVAGEALSHGGLFFNLFLIRPLGEALSRLERVAAAGATSLAHPTEALLAALQARAKGMGLDSVGARAALHRLGPSWKTLSCGLARARKEAARIESVLAVLPDLGGSASARLALALRLGGPAFSSIDGTEEIIARLLDEEDGASTSDGSGDFEFDDERAYEPPAALGSSRRNVFSDSLQEGSLRWAGHSGSSALDMSVEERQASKLRTLQLLREEERRAKEAEEREWEEAGLGDWMGGNARAVDVEDADVDEEELERFRASKDHLDETDEEGDTTDKGKGKGKALPPPPRDPQSRPSQAQNILLTTYALEGPGLFASTPMARQSKARAALKGKLDEEAARSGDGTRWADDLVESWARMLERNPRKDALLASATDAVKSGGNILDGGAGSKQADDSEEEGDTGPTFGPDRMRGGRIPGERGRGRGRGRGARGGGGGGPSASEQRASQSGHSGANRTRLDRQKESRGNAERKRGRDRKVRGGMVG